jgi:hypothetical protein
MQDASGTAAFDGDMIMATATMTSESPIRILPVFIGLFLVVLAWVGDTPMVVRVSPDCNVMPAS